MPGGAEGEDDEDQSVEGESRRRYKAMHRNMKSWQEQVDPNNRMHPTDELKTRKNMKEKTLYVHLVAHTHDDVGWIKTVDQYFSGTNQDAQHANVRLILDNVVQELIKDPKRVFTYVEMKFFTMWYNRQTPELKKQVKQLVKEGRLEFANGGWSATDEACPNYEDIINNMVMGHQFLKKEFGVKPRVGWHLDAFGHSSTNARLFADFGFEAQFFARLDRTEKDTRFKNATMEFLWRPQSTHFGT